MQIIAPGDDQYETLLKGILAHLDERARMRRETPELVLMRKELGKLEAEIESSRAGKLTDDEVFMQRQRKQQCEAIKTEIQHIMDDVHQAERPYRLHRRQFEDALEKHAALKNAELSTYANLKLAD